MRALITGANGTIGKELKRYLEIQGVEVYTWDRNKIPILEYSAMEEFVQKIKPDIIYHLAIASTLTGAGNETWRTNYEWPSELAWICRIQQIKFVITSTYEIFSDYTSGPFTLDTKPDAFEGFGFEKRMAEERALYQNPQSIVIRLPWQITNEPYRSGMIRHLDQEMEEYNRILASSKFYPCCAFLEDTVKEIYRISTSFDSGKFMIDSNDGLNFYEIVKNLKEIYNKNWEIVETEDYDYNQRMLDDRCSITPLSLALKFKLKEIELKSKKKLGIVGDKYIESLVESYEKLGYKVDTLVVSNPSSFNEFCKEHDIPNCNNNIDSLSTCDQIVVVEPDILTYEFLEKNQDKTIIFSGLPYLESQEDYDKYSKLFQVRNFYALLEFNQLLTIRKVKEKIDSGALGTINNIFLDIGVRNKKPLKRNFQEILINPLSFINDYFDNFNLDYSDYHEEGQGVFTYHSNKHQRMNINFFKLWYDGISIVMRFVGTEGELRVEGRYTRESGWNFMPILFNEKEYGQGESSSTTHEILNLALQEYIKKLEEIIYDEKSHSDIYTASGALELCNFFLKIWNK